VNQRDARGGISFALGSVRAYLKLLLVLEGIFRARERKGKGILFPQCGGF
jgi:hypothetical protein